MCRDSRLVALSKAERLRIDGSVPYRPSHSLAVPSDGGVYFIHDLRGCLYIGRSNCLNRRFHTHYTYSHNPRLRVALRSQVGDLEFSWVLAEGRSQSRLEQALIAQLQPLCNDIRYSHQDGVVPT